MDKDNGRRTLCEGRFLRLIDDNGWEYAERRNSRAVVSIVAVTDENCLLLVEQHRASMGGSVIEWPSGLVGDEGDKNEAIEVAANRELLEETGFWARSMEILTSGPTSTGVTNEIITLVLASGLLRKGPGGGVGDEKIIVYEVSLDEVGGWLSSRERAGFKVDPRIYAGLYFLCRARGKIRY